MQKIIEKINKEPTIFLLTKLFIHLESYRKQYGFGFLALLVAYIIESLIPLSVAWLINEVQVSGITSENIFTLLLIAGVPMAMQFIFLLIRKFALLEVLSASYQASKKNYTQYMVRNTLQMPLDWHSERQSGDTISKIQTAAQALVDFGRQTGHMIRSLTRFIVSTVAICFFVGWGSLLIILGIISVFATAMFFDRKIRRITKKINKITNGISAKIFDSLSNVSSISILHVEDHVSNNVEESLKEPYLHLRKRIQTNQTKWFTTIMLFQFFITFGVIAYYLTVNVGNDLLASAAVLTAIVLFVSQLSESFFNFTQLYSEYIKLQADFQNAEELENDFIKNKKIKRTHVRMSHNLKIEQLDFHYQQDDLELPALTNINIEIKKNEKIALIGQSGSGKTTFLKVLHGLYEGSKSKLVIDNEENSAQLHAIDLATTLVPQEPELFSSTVLENITFGLDYSDIEIKSMTDLAQFTSVINDLPGGLESKINEKGVNLSGGQKQRLALARALLFAQEKDIILLDESTSSVDPETEVKIYENIFKQFKGKTFIASIHKLNLLKYFDRIIVFENGSIVGQGTFEELVKESKQFESMWESYIKSASSI